MTYESKTIFVNDVSYTVNSKDQMNMYASFGCQDEIFCDVFKENTNEYNRCKDYIYLSYDECGDSLCRDCVNKSLICKDCVKIYLQEIIGSRLDCMEAVSLPYKRKVGKDFCGGELSIDVLYTSFGRSIYNWRVPEIIYHTLLGDKVYNEIPSGSPDFNVEPGFKLNNSYGKLRVEINVPRIYSSGAMDPYNFSEEYYWGDVFNSTLVIDLVPTVKSDGSILCYIVDAVVIKGEGYKRAPSCFGEIGGALCDTDDTDDALVKQLAEQIKNDRTFPDMFASALYWQFRSKYENYEPEDKLESILITTNGIRYFVKKK